MDRRFSNRVRNALAGIHRSDALFVAAALVCCWFTLFYPYGRDQGLFHYIGREWFRGALPYRDAIEHKPPVIFLVYGVANLLLGEHMWSVRVLEILFVLTVGWNIGTTATPRGQEPLPGVRGAAAFIFVILYYGMLGFWNTAQCEIFYGGFALLSLCAAERSERPRAGPAWSGFWTGLSCLVKPPAVFVCLVIVFALVTRMYTKRDASEATRPRRTRALAAFGYFVLGALVPTVLTLAYFGARGGLGEFYDDLIPANAYYRSHEGVQHGWGEIALIIARGWQILYPASGIALLAGIVGLVLGIRARNAERIRRYAIPLLFELGCLGAIGVQGLYFPYHFGVFHIGWTLPIVLALHDVIVYQREALKRPLQSAAVASAACWLVLVAWSSTGEPARTQWDNYRATLAYLGGKMDKHAFDSRFDIPNFYEYTSNVAIGDWLRENSRPEDLVAVRGFEPAIYAIARRQSGLRFFWTTWIALPHRAYRREEWLKQDGDQIRAHTPRFVVAANWVSSGPDRIQYFWPYGHWVERMRSGGMTIYERVSDEPTPPEVSQNRP